MTSLLTQSNIEERMYSAGINRAESMMSKAEDSGRANQNPYMKEIYSDYVLPLAAAIRSEVARKSAGVRQAHAALLDGLDADAVSYLAVRAIVNNLLSPDPDGHRRLAYEIGRQVHCELVLSQIEEALPELYSTLTRDFGRKLTKSERHRMTVYKMQAHKAGIEFIEWNIGSREQVGFYLLGMLEASGLITMDPEIRKGYIREQRTVYLNPEVIDRIDQIKAFVAVTMPVYGPCIEPPKDWGLNQTGGFHTDRMRRVCSNLVHSSSRAASAMSMSTDMPIVHAAVNAIQKTAWKINTRLLDTIYKVAAAFSTKEIVSLADSPAPAKPDWLVKGVDKTTLSEQHTKEFVQWKHDMAEWYTQRKLMGTRYGRFYSATRMAEMYKDYPAIYFVHFADSRGRLYPMTYGINPQGSDMAKSLLHFAEGKPLLTPDAHLWFHVQGANKWGFDKATLQDRRAWVLEREDQIRLWAADPVENDGWKEADDPLQFLAWCFEFADYKTNPNFVSHLPISMDGSCNGLQNLSAMFRDSIGGKATNLTNNPVMEDIYSNVAKAATVRLAAMVLDDPDEVRFRDVWLAHGISRKAVKRSVMTTPYGVTLRSAIEYVIDDYLREGLGPTFDKKEYRKAATLLMKAVWPAISDVVVKGREAMDWLRKCARPALKGLDEDAAGLLRWDTPSGFPACQVYYEAQVHRINTRLHGPLKIRVLSETDEASKAKHATGLAPNFVHSMDAAHLHLSSAEAARSGITALAMIHDDYGTHAADAQQLYDIIRRQFVAMYVGFDPVEAFVARYPDVPAPPIKGTLDIMEVLESDYFFS